MSEIPAYEAAKRMLEAVNDAPADTAMLGALIANAQASLAVATELRVANLIAVVDAKWANGSAAFASVAEDAQALVIRSLTDTYQKGK